MTEENNTVRGMRVFFATGDTKLRSSLAEQWAADGVREVVEAQTYDQACMKCIDGIYEFMVLDFSLPGGSGNALCRALRESGVTCPIVVLSASASDEDLIAALAAGANDYVVKPFRNAVLMARVMALLRSHRSSEEAVYAIGPYTFRPGDKVLLEGDRRIRLTEKETDVLKLLRRSGRTVSRDVLLSDVWGYNPAASTHTIETHIYRLRQKLERDMSKCRLLLTEKDGYRLNCFAVGQ